MARVTVEDCILNIPNRFELVSLAAQRARQIATGNPLTIDRDNDKDAVVSLREIADETIDLGQIQEDLIQGLQKRSLIEKLEHEQQMQRMREDDGADEGEVAEAFQDAAQLPTGEMAAASSDEDQAALTFGDDNLDVED